MTFIGRTASAATIGDNVSARLNQAGEIVTIPWLTQMALEGRVFVAGHGVEEAGIDGEAAVNDTTPSFALTAGNDTIVIPLWFRAYFDTEGGAAPVWHLAYCQSTKGVSGAGTAVTAIPTLGGLSPRTSAAEAQTSLSGVTAIVAAEYVVLTERIHVLDNYVSAEAATTVAGAEAPGGRYSNMEAVYEFDKTPIALTAGASVLFYTATGVSDSKYNYSMCWVEVPADVYGI
jgi:hypothetical protein